MEIRHRVTFGHRDSVDAAVETLNIRHTRSPLPGGGYLIHIDVTESDPRWPLLVALVREKNALDMCNTVFTPEEILGAAWSRLTPNFEQGYPQPKEAQKDWAWREATYEHVCPRCGVGYRQKAPFRLAREPRPGKHDFMSLFWTYTVFCTPRVVEALQAHKLQGYEVWEAIINDTDQPSQVISQLVFPTVAGPGLARYDKQKPEKCWRCGITKYAFHMRGYMHLQRKALRPDVDFQLTHEWFGSDTRWGYREILISNRVARLVLESGWRGVALKPVELV